MADASTSPLIALLGDKLLKGKETVSTTAALSGKKAIGLYYSAHWCPPCRGFTPKLAEWYKDSLQAKGLEIIFVSSDKTQDAFDDYYGEQPWLALPYGERDLKAKLSKKHKVNGIPSFIIIGEDGEVITSDGREAVSEDPKGENLPWKPPTFWEALGTDFLSGSDGETVEVDELQGKGKVIGLYFSAHWCPPCKHFTPELVKAYKAHLKAKNLEIIFVSSDKNAKEFQEYYKEMPWLAIPNGDKRKGLLSSRFGVEGIPTFVLVDGETGETITTKARGNVSSDPEGNEFPWVPKALVDMTKDGPDGINETTALCVMLDGCDADAVAAGTKVLEPIAEAYKAAKEELLFFFAPKSEGPVEQIRQLTKLGSKTSTPQMVILDIPDNGGYYTSPATELTTETVSGFLEAFKAGALERQQLG